MTVQRLSDGSYVADKCDLCNNTRKIVTDFSSMIECPWCKSVKLKYGSYWYPITSRNCHLFNISKEKLNAN